MHIFNLYNILLVCLIGIVYSSWHDDYDIDPIKNDTSKKFTKKKISSKKKRYALDIRSFGEQCVIKYEEICETGNYDIHIKNGIKGHAVKVMLVQKNKSDLVSVHSLNDRFSDSGYAIFHFKNIPSMHYSIILEVSDLIHNSDYDIGEGCNCIKCNDYKREIDLEKIEDKLIHKIRSDTKNLLLYPQKSFVNGKYLFDRFLLFHAERNKKTIEDYETLYRDYYELVYPCSGIMMTHSEKYNLNYDLTSVKCYYVHLMDKFLKKINSNSTYILKFKTPILLEFEQNASNDDIRITPNYTIYLPLKYKDSFYVPRGTVNGSLVTINTYNYLFSNKYIYKNNNYNRMEHVHLFRIFFKLFSKHNSISSEEMLQYTTGMTLEKPPTYMDKPYNIYSEELAVLLNSLNFEFNADLIGLKKNAVILDERVYTSHYNSNSYAYIENNQLVLRESSEICLVTLGYIAQELSEYINNKLSEENKSKCHILKNSASYANISTMHFTYELDCNSTLYYMESIINQDENIKPFLSNKTIIEDISVKLLYDDIFSYSILLYVTINEYIVDIIKKYAPKYLNEQTAITLTVVGRRSDDMEEQFDHELKKIVFPIYCDKNCSSYEPIIIKDNLDYIAINKICIENMRLPSICLSEYSFSYIFDTRLLRVYTLNLNPYPETVLTLGVHTAITEEYYCVLMRQPNIIPNNNIPNVYIDNVCKELINRCDLLTTKVFVENVTASSNIKNIYSHSKLSFLTGFHEKHEEMLQITYSTENTNIKKKHLLTHYSDGFYTNMHDNKISLEREKERFKRSLQTQNYYDEGDDYYNDDLQVEENQYNIEIFNDLDLYDEKPTHIQTSKNNDISLYPFGQISVNYNHLKKNMYMKFLNDHIYFYEKEETNSDISPYFINVSPYNYECLGAYAYLINKFNILVNNSLNCEAVNMIVEVLLKGNLGKYFIQSKNKIHLNFFKRHKDSYDVFDLVDVEIYAPNTPQVPINKYTLNVSIDEINQNLLYLHKNIEYTNKYFSNVYIMMFKIAYLFSDYDFHTFFNDLTGIILVDTVILQNLSKLQPSDKINIQNIENILKDEYEIFIEKHTQPSDKIINEISLLAAYIVELRSSYKKYAFNTDIISFADIKYFVYVDEFKYKNIKHTINEMVYKLSKYNALVIKKKALCCSNFVNEVEQSLKYYILYKYIVTDRFVQESEAHIIQKSHSIIQKLLERPISSSDIHTQDENELNYIINLIMNESGYIHRKNPSLYIDMECVNLDIIDHYENIIKEFRTFIDSNGVRVDMLMSDSLPDNSITLKEDMDYHIYFLFRNLSMPFIGKTNKKETLGLRRFLLTSGTFYRSKNGNILSCYLDIVNKDSIFMLEKIIFVSKSKDRLVKEINVEYQTFFVHPFNLLSDDFSLDKNNLIKYYFESALKCYHYNDGLQNCEYPPYSYDGFTPYYVSYFENNQKKEILFSDDENIAKALNNFPLFLSHRYKLPLNGEKMSSHIYSIIRDILQEITSSMGIYDFSKKNCDVLHLNNNQLNLENDKNSLISNILFDNKYCINRSAIFNKVLKICTFNKEELVSLFGSMTSNILPYRLNENFSNLLTLEELLNLIFYFTSSPPQMLSDIKAISLYLEISELNDSSDKKVIVEKDSIKINKKLLNYVDKNSLVLFNTLLYEQLFKFISDVNDNKKYILSESEKTKKSIPETINYHMDRYINNMACDNSIFTNAGSILKADGSPSHHYPSFTYTDNDIYVKQQTDESFAFNNLFIFKGMSQSKGEYIKAIIVLSLFKFNSLKLIENIELIGNSWYNNNQITMKCYADKNYKNDFIESYNLEKNSVYFVCDNVYTKYHKSDVYEFNKFLISFGNDGNITRHMYQDMPIRPLYKIANKPLMTPLEEPSIKIQLINDNLDTSHIMYSVNVNGNILLDKDPYAVIKPIFTSDSYLYNTSISIYDDYVTYKYPRKPKYSEFLDLPISKNIFKGDSLNMSVGNINETNNKIDNVYVLKMVKSFNLLSLIIRDMFNNEYVADLTKMQVMNIDHAISHSEDEYEDHFMQPHKNIDNNETEETNIPQEEIEVEEVNHTTKEDEKTKHLDNMVPLFRMAYLFRIENIDISIISESEKLSYFKVTADSGLNEDVVDLSIDEDSHKIKSIRHRSIDSNLLDNIFEKMNDKKKFQIGNYVIKIFSINFYTIMVPIGKEKEVTVEYIDGDEVEKINKIIEDNNKQKNLGNSSSNISKLGISEPEKLKPEINENLDSQDENATFFRSLYYPISVKRLDDNSFNMGVILYTGSVSENKYNIQVKNGEYSGTCISGKCNLNSKDLKEFMNVVSKQIMDGTYELNIKKHIKIDNQRDQEPLGNLDIPIILNRNNKINTNMDKNWIKINISGSTFFENKRFTETFTLEGYNIKKGLFEIFSTGEKYIMRQNLDKNESLTLGELKEIILIIGYELPRGEYTIYIEKIDTESYIYNDINQYNDNRDNVNRNVVKEDIVSFRSTVKILDDGNHKGYSLKKIVEGNDKDMQTGEYFVQVNNEIYNTTSIKGPPISEEKMKSIIQNAWNSKDSILISYYVEIFNGEDILKNCIDKNEQEYFLIINTLSDKEDTIHNTENIKFFGKNIENGDYHVDVFDNTYTSKPVSGPPLNSKIIEELMALSYKKANGKFFISIRKKDNICNTIREKEKTITARCVGDQTGNNYVYKLDDHEMIENLDVGLYQISISQDGKCNIEGIHHNDTEEKVCKIFNDLRNKLSCDNYQIQVETKIKEEVYIPYSNFKETIPIYISPSHNSYNTNLPSHIKSQTYSNPTEYKDKDSNRTTAYYQAQNNGSSIKTTLCSSPVSSSCKNNLRNSK
ncbi:oocyst capsule protein, putative [Plasmodium gallinaceum]|uniref:Oocyst capsule protein, putative n=1 Tax=Plasmodium gallinaceum TaxID=5849 RepID=A0A1J1GP36_PLAGA|nr:oocyst capsule protein, putative [Plasmodium gallinaceum]CRG94255.1 oocyst capsule protein, putative [Plasmodium gallinaceum]